MASLLDPLALGVGRTVGPGVCAVDGSGGWGAAFIVVAFGGGAGELVAAEARGERAGYFRAAEPAALAALDDADPMMSVGASVKKGSGVEVEHDECRR